jgi:hypothetical protein
MNTPDPGPLERARALLADDGVWNPDVRLTMAELVAEVERLKEWRDSVSSAVKSAPEFHSGHWAGDKEGWGFHFEFIRWLIRERAELVARVVALEEEVADHKAAFALLKAMLESERLAATTETPT